MNEIHEHVSVFPTESLKTGLAFVKGQPVSKLQASLAAVNIASYASNTFFNDGPEPMFATMTRDIGEDDPPTQEEAEAAFETALAEADQTPGQMRALVPMKGAFLTILTTLLPLILQLLKK